MFYKITNTESKVYKELFALRKEEISIERKNREEVKKVVGCDWDEYLGCKGQQNFWRVTLYSGFAFKHPDRLPAKTWKQHKEYPHIYIPNTRTKLGRQMQSFLGNLPHSSFIKVLSILECPIDGRVVFPYVEIGCGDVIVLYMGDRYDEILSKNKDIIEITKREFNEIRSVEQEGGEE